MSKFDVIILVVMLVSLFLIIYHHILYPMLLERKYFLERLEKTANFFRVGKKNREHVRELDVSTIKRNYRNSKLDEELKGITLIIPAYNEEYYIAEKIRNLSQLDYPSDLLTIYLACDGCNDKTVDIARSVLNEPECMHLKCMIFDFTDNHGKLNTINRVMKYVNTPFVAFSDVSALLAHDILLISSKYFKFPDIGAIAGGYELLKNANAGESTYWHYQNNIKRAESSCGSVLGCHGAFYIFRAELFEQLPGNTINDDFVLPMCIVKQGYRVIYEPEASAIELEASSLIYDYKRRIRISAGNLQQAWYLRHCLLPQYGITAINFLSGKVLRVFMPLCLFLCFVASAYLSHVSWFFSLVFLIQLAFYSLIVLIHLLHINTTHNVFKLIDYIVTGHWASILGSYALLTGRYQAPFKRVKD